ncbi:hypothetical protein VTK26DRAFT_6184 [Humicola hyalothermophila]
MPSALLREHPISSHFAPPSPASSAQCGHRRQASCREHQPFLPRGLCTPPADPDENDKMGTAVEVSHLAGCENYRHHRLLHHPQPYSAAPPPSDRCRSVLDERPAPNEQTSNPTSRCHAQLVASSHPATSTRTRAPAQPAAASSKSTSSHSQRQQPSPHRPLPSAAPMFRNNTAKGAQGTMDTRMTTHSLTTPARLSPKGGDLASFMAEVAALFWFESIEALRNVEQGRTPMPPLASSAVATQHFKRWVLTVLTTTQVTQNVVILALLYVYRLKVANPTVKGRAGSEYRLLTVALMLGNKFLDDNTYTNKTWADVSGIPVTEIHVMEVEFLSNLRYSLLVSADEWERWLDTLAGFWSYLELAQRPPPSSLSPLHIPSPGNRSFASPLPSPTGPPPPTPSFSSAGHLVNPESPAEIPFRAHAQGFPAPYVANNAASPLALKPQPQPYLKRSLPEEDATEPPAKRMSRVPVVGSGQPLAQQVPSQGQLGPQNPRNVPVLRSRPTPGVAIEQGRLAVPSLTLNTTQVSTAPTPAAQPQPYAGATYAPSQPSSLSLPPLVPGIRAMSTVYPPTTIPSLQSTPTACSAVTPTTSYNSSMSYGTPSKRLSPRNALAANTTPYAGSSPLIDPPSQHMGNGGSASGLHTPISHSPSVYLQHRNSPYKPVRHVNTLLYPPPSAFLQQYHLPNPVLPNQMHYRPVGKRAEYRTGIVPEFMMGNPTTFQGHPAGPVGYTPTQPMLPTEPSRARFSSQPAPPSTAYTDQY